MKNKKCKYCKINLKLGESVDFVDENIKTEYTHYSEGKLVRCWKCPQCGHSESLQEK